MHSIRDTPYQWLQEKAELPTVVLGINAYHGDVSAALLRDSELVAAVEEERFRRVKHWALALVCEDVLMRPRRSPVGHAAW